MKLVIIFITINTVNGFSSNNFLYGNQENPTVNQSIYEAYGYTRKCCKVKCGKTKLVSMRQELICDTNGDRYDSRCEFDCVVFFYKKFGQDLKEWPCGARIPKCERNGIHEYAECYMECFCPERCPTICATNSLMYTNACFFNCVKRYHDKYDPFGKGLIRVPCDKDHSSTPACPHCCSCPRYLDNVCTWTGDKYYNICAFDCAREYYLELGEDLRRRPCNCGPGDPGFSTLRDNSITTQNSSGGIRPEEPQVTPPDFPPETPEEFPPGWPTPPGYPTLRPKDGSTTPPDFAPDEPEEQTPPDFPEPTEPAFLPERPTPPAFPTEEAAPAFPPEGLTPPDYPPNDTVAAPAFPPGWPTTSNYPAEETVPEGLTPPGYIPEETEPTFPSGWLTPPGYHPTETVPGGPTPHRDPPAGESTTPPDFPPEEPAFPATTPPDFPPEAPSEPASTPPDFPPEVPSESSSTPPDFLPEAPSEPAPTPPNFPPEEPAFPPTTPSYPSGETTLKEFLKVHNVRKHDYDVWIFAHPGNIKNLTCIKCP